MNVLAFDLGGSRIKTGYVADGVLKDFDVFPVPVGSTISSVLDLAAGRAENAIKTGGYSSVDLVGIAYPGLVDPIKKQVISASGKHTDATEFDFSGWASERFGCGCFIENDANAALLGEIGYGCAAGETDAVLMILGTGVGTAAVMNGELVRGKHFQAGCLGGHFPVGGEAWRCSCGGYGCVEANGSSWALKNMLEKHPAWDKSPVKSEKVLDFRALEKGIDLCDTASKDVFSECLKNWARGLISMIYAYDPETVVLSGGAVKMGKRLTEPLTRTVLERVWTPWGKIKFRISEMPERSVVLGLAVLAEKQS